MSSHCGITQKKDKCLENCYAQAKVSQDDNQFVVTFFHEELMKHFHVNSFVVMLQIIVLDCIFIGIFLHCVAVKIVK